MRPTLGLIIVSCASWIRGVAALDSRQDGASMLNACAATCLQQVLQTTACQLADPCFCTDASLSKNLAACVAVSCTTDEQLAAQKLYADTCNWPVHNQSMLIGNLTWALFAVATVFVIARCLSRWTVLDGAGFHWDDWVLIGLCPFAIACVPALHLGVQNGWGRDVWELSAAEIERFLYWFYICQIMYMVITFGSKLSLCLLYLRTWPDKSQTWFRGINWAIVVALIFTIIGVEMATIFQCVPIHYTWSTVVAVANEHCTDRTAQVFAVAGLNIAFDIIVLTIPLPKLLKLDITWQRKVGLLLVFLVGGVVTVCSCVRISYMDEFANTDNVTWDYRNIGIWSIIEVYLSIACACMPATAGLLKRTVHHIFRRHEEELSTLENEEAKYEDPESARELKTGAGSPGNSSEKHRYSEMSSSDVSPQPALIRRQSSMTSHGYGPLLYLDEESGIRFEVKHEPLSEPVVAKLSYVDQNSNLRNVELQGRW